MMGLGGFFFKNLYFGGFRLVRAVRYGVYSERYNSILTGLPPVGSMTSLALASILNYTGIYYGIYPWASCQNGRLTEHYRIDRLRRLRLRLSGFDKFWVFLFPELQSDVELSFFSSILVVQQYTLFQIQLNSQNVLRNEYKLFEENWKHHLIMNSIKRRGFVMCIL
ncbi:hypothetical protein evm_005270 [Chilo suppressalis]|nr:hypothetical protein evm_005270 [Chilo suppressalis]